jgi:uncharacterized protein (TIGR00251 family)
MALQLEHRDGRILLRLRVSPKSRRARILGEHGGACKLHVTEAPENGRANEGVIALLASALGISPRQIELVSGHTSQDKRVALRGIEEAALRALLEQGEH